MTQTLFHAYTPLLIWTGLGILLFRFIPQRLPKLLGRGLYWIGVPIEIFALARQTDFSHMTWMAPAFTLGTVVMGMVLGFLGFQLLELRSQGSKWHSMRQDLDASFSCEGQEVGFATEPGAYAPWLTLVEDSAKLSRSRQGSFVLSAMLGNTGFVGLAIATSLISSANMSWPVFYTITQNVCGTYGIGVLIASYFGHSQVENQWWTQLRDLLSVPSLWAFGLGLLSQRLTFPAVIDTGLHQAIWIVIPCAFVLTGMRLSQLQGLKSLKIAILPTVLKILVLPAVVGLVTSLLGLSGEPRLALVLMAGMPTAFATLVLAEEYNLDREMMSSSIALSTIALLASIPLWMVLFG